MSPSPGGQFADPAVLLPFAGHGGAGCVSAPGQPPPGAARYGQISSRRARWTNSPARDQPARDPTGRYAGRAAVTLEQP